MSFNILSKNGLHEMLPFEIQEYIADIVLPYKYKTIFNDVLLEIDVELSTGSAMPINNIEKTFAEIAYDRLINFTDQYHLYMISQRWLKQIQEYTTNNINIDTILWGMDPSWVNFHKTINKIIILGLSYQELLDLIRYVNITNVSSSGLNPVI